MQVQNKQKYGILIFLIIFEVTLCSDCNTDYNCKRCSQITMNVNGFMIPQNFCVECNTPFTPNSITNVC